MEKDIKKVEKIIRDFCKEVGGNPDDIIKIGLIDDNYQVIEKGGKQVTIDKKLIENYRDSSLSRMMIIQKIKKLMSMSFDDILIATEKEEFCKHNDYNDYEYFVSKVIQEFEVFKNVKIERNIRLDGATQPGKYEIDIFITIPCDIMEFKIIIECKNWAKPVGREVVQKVLNTKNAVNASKAAIVSPVGYTKEAVQVAKHYSIALWVLNLKIFNIIKHIGISEMLYGKEQEKYDILCDFQAKYYDTKKIKEMLDSDRSELKLVEFKEKYSDTSFDPFNLDLQCWSDQSFYIGDDGIDFRLVTTRIAAEIEMMNQP